MIFLAKLNLTLSHVRPLWYLLTYLIAIPAFGLLYTIAAPRGFYAPYVRYEPDAASDATQLASMLEAALHRSFDERIGEQLVIGNCKLDLDSLRVYNVRSIDGTMLSFTVSITLNGIGEFERQSWHGWSIVTTVPGPLKRANISGPNSGTFYHLPEADFSKYTSPFKEYSENLFKIMFSPGNSGISAPVLALTYQEEQQLRRYFKGESGDPSAVSGHFWRMVYLSAIVITTLGLGDIVPITRQARILVASEAIAGIVLAGLF